MKDSKLKYDPGLRRSFIAVLVTALSILWFYFPGEYVLLANRDQGLFMLRGDYLFSFLDRPGGLLEYLGSFLNQFLRFRFAGALLLSAIPLAGFLLSVSLVEKISKEQDLLIPGMLSSVLLVGMHNFYPHQLMHSLGLLLAMWLAVLAPVKQAGRSLFLALSVPLAYFLTGGFVWVFCGLILLEEYLRSGKLYYKNLILSLLYPALLVLSGAWLLFLEPLRELAGIHLPFGPAYGSSMWPLFFLIWIALYILLAGLARPALKLKAVWKHMIQVLIVLVVTAPVMHYSFSRKNKAFFQIEKLALLEDWDGLLAYTEQHPSRNLFGTYYTNLALVNKSKLCTDLFRYPQSFGRRGLCFEWDAKGEILRRGSDFFWTVNFVNEAHHWAFESMVIDGFTGRNLRRLIQAELVRGNFKIAEKYIDHMAKAMFHGKTADRYKHFLNSTQAMATDPELGPPLAARMEQDFFAEGLDMEKNLRLLLENDPGNRHAFDYLMALLLLEKRVEEINALLPAYQEASKTPLPVLLDECLLVYKITHPEDTISNLRVSSPTMERFRAYSQVLRQYNKPRDAARALYPEYGYSFWFHLNFSSMGQN